MEVQIRRYSFQSKYDGVPIHGVCMIPEKPVGIIQFVHGMSEHKERFYGWMEEMSRRGYITLIHDNRGHGQSVKCGEDLGYCYASGEEGLVEDIYMATVQIRKRYPDLPLILYGHSMGSLAVRAYLWRHESAIDALAVGGCPSYNRGVPFGIALLSIIAFCKGDRYRSERMQKMVTDSFERRFRAENRKGAWLAAKRDVAENFQKDALCQFTYTVNGLLTLLRLEWIVYRKRGHRAACPMLPILFLSGEDDPCYISKKRFFRAMERLEQQGYHCVLGKLFPGMRHEIHNEADCGRVYDALDHFARKVIVARQTPNADTQNS